MTHKGQGENDPILVVREAFRKTDPFSYKTLSVIAAFVAMVMYIWYQISQHANTTHVDVVIAGMSGIGKSTLGNNFLFSTSTRDRFGVCGDPAPCTRLNQDLSTTRAYRWQPWYMLGWPQKWVKMRVVDSIGFSDVRSSQSDSKTLASIQDKISSLKSKKKALIYLVNAGRLLKSDLKLMFDIKSNLIDPDDKVILVINRLSRNPDDVQQLKGYLVGEWDKIEASNVQRPTIVLLREKPWIDKSDRTIYYNDADIATLLDAIAN